MQRIFYAKSTTELNTQGFVTEIGNAQVCDPDPVHSPGSWPLIIGKEHR